VVSPGFVVTGEGGAKLKIRSWGSHGGLQQLLDDL